MKIIKEINHALSGFPLKVIKDIEEQKITSEELFSDMGLEPFSELDNRDGERHCEE